MHKKTILTLAGFFLIQSLPAFADPNLEIGLYDMTTEVQMPEIPGLPASAKNQLQKQTSQVCIKDKDLKTVLGKFTPEKNCKISNMKESTNEVTWDTSCQGKGFVMTAKGKVELKGKSFSGTTKTETKINGGQKILMGAKVEGKHIGPCK